MKKFTAPAIALAISFTFSAGAMAQTLSSNEYKTGMDSIAAEHKSDKAICESLSGNANDVCIAEANGKEKVAKADLEARNKNTNEARYEALVTKADAEYSVAKEKCDDQAGNIKDVCLKEAKAAEIAAKADAKSQRKVSKANKEANKESAEARHDAATDKHAANYAVAKEKCDALAGGAKASCMNDAKIHHGQR